MIKTCGNREYTDMVVSAIKNKYPGKSVKFVCTEERFSYRIIQGILYHDKVPEDVNTVNKISDCFGLDRDAAYKAYLRQANPDMANWVETFDKSDCCFSDLIRYYRISNGISRDEMDAKLLITVRGNSRKYETGERVPAPDAIVTISRNLSIDEKIVADAIAKQWHLDGFSKSAEDTLDTPVDVPCVIESSDLLCPTLAARARQFDFTYGAYFTYARNKTGKKINLIFNDKVVNPEDIANLAAWLNVDIVSLIDAYRDNAPYQYLTTNFGYYMFTVCACLGMTTTSINEILGMCRPMVWDYMVGKIMPKTDTIIRMSKALGINVSVLYSMFENKPNFKYYRKSIYKSVKYIICKYWQSLNSLNVHIINQLFKEEN